MSPNNPKLLQIVTKCADLSKDIQRFVPHHRGHFSVSITNQGDFSCELIGEDGEEGGYAPTHNQLNECISFIVHDTGYSPISYRN